MIEFGLVEDTTRPNSINGVKCRNPLSQSDVRDSRSLRSCID